MRLFLPILLAVLVACGDAANASADSFGLDGSSESGGLWNGPNMIDPGSRFQLDTIQPGPALHPDGPLSAPASLGRPGPLALTPGVGLQPAPRRGIDLGRLTPSKPNIYFNKPDIFDCEGLAQEHPGQQIGPNATYCGYGHR